MSAHQRPAQCALLLLVVLAVGCAKYPLNAPSERFDAQAGYRFDLLDKRPENSDSLFVCLMFSGGGTRAAALSYGIMEALRDTTIQVDGQKKRLLDEVDAISSVSGGSFTAAYYGLFREKLFSDFRPAFLERNIQGALAVGLFNPVNWFRLASPLYSRIDMAAELYNKEIFEQATFGDLTANGRPFVILNATNLGPGRRFDFTQTHFDAMASRLDNYPIARAVAASSAFPYLLTPISLVNYPFPDYYGYQQPWWFEGALDEKYWYTERYDAARNLSLYLAQKGADNPAKVHPYVHLMDGGLSDNIGARAILDAFNHGFIRTRINLGEIRQLVVIVVNARTQGEEPLSRKKAPPGFFKVAEKTATVSMDNYSFESITRLRQVLLKRVQDQMSSEACCDKVKKCDKAAPCFVVEADVDPYLVEINFEAAAQLTDEDPNYYLNLPTSFKLDKTQVAKLVAVGPKLLQAAPQYQCLLKVLAAEAQGLPRPEQCPIGSGIQGPKE